MALKINRRDIDFILYEQLDVEKAYAEIDDFKDFTREDYDMVITEAHNFALKEVEPLNAIGDTVGAKFENGVVTLPQEFKDTYRKLTENGWASIGSSPEYGGGGFPTSVGIAASEAFTAACVSFMFTVGLSRGNCAVIEEFGTEEQKATFCEKLTSGEWSGTMCLTEPGAGTAVGDLSTRAVKDGDEYLISGTKCFITSAEHDLTDNIIHLVLARVEGAPKGIKGISLFIVPKNRINEDGTAGEPNDVVCGGIEHKMGLHGSPTCVMNFGENGRCRGQLIGEENKGIVYMFHMMNEARISCGLQGLAQGAACLEYARQYAHERIQGVDIREMRNAYAERVPIVNHPDIRRSLMLMKSYTEGLRSLILFAALQTDLLKSGDKAVRDKADDLLAILTPVIKGYGTDIGFKCADLAMMVHGGYGYTAEYPVEQQMRDVKAASIYEGCNGIQALDLVGRKLGMKGGMALMSYLMDINQFVAANEKHESLAPLFKQFTAARDALVGCVTQFQQLGATKEVLIPVLNATPFLNMFGHVVLAYNLLQQAVIANEKLDAIFDEKDAADDEAKNEVVKDSPNATFYHNKIKTASFFIFNVLPEVSSIVAAIRNADRSALDVILDY